MTRLPSERSAYAEACKNANDPDGADWSHQSVFIAGRETGFFELSGTEGDVMFQKFCHNYRAVCYRTDPDQAIPDDLSGPSKRKPPGNAVAKKHLGEIKAMLGGL